ncbi:hypothetical protein KAR91_80325 [Candidatus Pacearchaeota archaeon]|nr:hypothetical protein [Candidatus Pacearchaeota archaeon]
MRGKNKPYYNIDREYENLINEIRVEKGLTLKELASLIGTSPSHLWNISQGLVSPFHEKDSYLKGVYLKGGSLKEWALHLEKVFGYDLSEIFPREICSIEANSLTDEQVAYIAHSFGDVYGDWDAYSRDTRKFNTYISVLSIMEKYLNHTQRNIITLIYFGNRNYREIGKIYGRTEGSVRQLEERVLRLIRFYYYRFKKYRSHLLTSEGG